MRKIVLAAAIATSAFGLAACSETTEAAGETVDAMAADAEANAEAAGEMAGEMAGEAADAAEGAADAAGEAAEGAADAAGEAVDGAAEAAGDAVDAAAEKAEGRMQGEEFAGLPLLLAGSVFRKEGRYRLAPPFLFGASNPARGCRNRI